MNKLINLRSRLQIGRYSDLSNVLSQLEGNLVLIYVHLGQINVKYLESPNLFSVEHKEIILLSKSNIINIEKLYQLDCIIFSFVSNIDPITKLKKIHVDDPRYQNKWIAGYGNTPLITDNMSLVHVRFQNREEFYNKLLPQEIYHLHQQGDEYYLPLLGGYQIIVEGRKHKVDPFTVVEMQAGLCHMWEGANFPVIGINFRYPSLDGDKFPCT